jgi:hypothetical protein
MRSVCGGKCKCNCMSIIPQQAGGNSLAVMITTCQCCTPQLELWGAAAAH